MEKESTAGAPPARWKILDGAALKLLAVVTMFIDHCAASVFTTLLVPLRRAEGIFPALSAGERRFYWFLRGVGRPAFPIFCFLLVEGFTHTRDVRRYLGRLLIFGLISELPFDQALFGGFTWDFQNVYFTLFLGLAAVWAISQILGEDFARQPWGRKLFQLLGCAAAAAAAMEAAELLHTDYGWGGVALILAMYLFRRRPLLRDAGGALATLTAGNIEMAGWYAFPLFHLYNGQRGRQTKYFFYAFYPGHLALLWLLRVLLLGE